MITKEQLNFLRKEFGNLLTVINPNTKRPKGKTWHYNWSDQELLNAESIGVYHQEKIDDIKKKTVFGATDPDDKSYVIHEYCKLLPDTFTITKNVNGKPIQTQRIYKVNGAGFPKFDYGGDSKDDGKLIETLQSGVSVIHAKDKDFNMVPPTTADNDEILKKLKLSCFFTEVEKHFPNKGGRDKAHLRLAGALARLDQEEYPNHLLEDFVLRLCINTNDTETKNRLNKIDYQRLQLAAKREVFGVKELCSYLKIKQLPAYDLFKSNVEEIKNYPVRTFGQMLHTKYPEPKFIAEPILREKTVMQISGDYGSGKTHLGLKLALDVSQGWSFFPSKEVRPWYHTHYSKPVLYVEGELPAADVRDRVNSLVEPYIESKHEVDFENLFILTLDDLEMNGFQNGFEPLAISNEEDKAKRNRKLVENMIKTIKFKTGKNPIIFLDNITALTSIDENKSTDWREMMMWLMQLKTRGIVTVFFHHTGKTTGTASGSNLSQRLVDTHIILKKLPEKAAFEEHDGVQCSVHFDKFRNFGGSRAKPFMLLCDKQGQWTKYNMLMDQKDFKIMELYKEGKTAQEINKIDKELGAVPTIYRRIGKMKSEGVIEEDDKSHY